MSPISTTGLVGDAGDGILRAVGLSGNSMVGELVAGIGIFQDGKIFLLDPCENIGAGSDELTLPMADGEIDAFLYAPR